MDVQKNHVEVGIFERLYEKHSSLYQKIVLYEYKLLNMYFKEILYKLLNRDV